VVEREGESTAHGFITRLSALGYRVRRRAVRVHRADDQGRTVLEGDWDMGIAADIVRAWDHLDVVVLASGDGDFVPILELAQERGKRVEVLAFREASAQTLIDLADRFVHLGDVEGIYLPEPRGGRSTRGRRAVAAAAAGRGRSWRPGIALALTGGARTPPSNPATDQ
jgi:uncharacterized LabA/DUF88 family protein